MIEFDFVHISKSTASLGIDQALADEIGKTAPKEYVAFSPCREVVVEAFHIMKNMITNSQFLNIAQDIRSERILNSFVLPDADLDPNAPFVGINAIAADAIAKRLGARLPSEDEWELVMQKEHLVPECSSVEVIEGPRVGNKGICWNPFEADEWTSSSCLEYGQLKGRIVKGCPPGMTLAHTARRYCLQPKNIWACTGFRLVKAG